MKFVLNTFTLLMGLGAHASGGSDGPGHGGSGYPESNSKPMGRATIGGNG